MLRWIPWNNLRRKISTSSNGRPPAQTLKRAAIVTLKITNYVCALHLFLVYVGGISFTAGPSMLPTLAESGEIILVDCLTYRLNPKKLARGDLVTLVSPLDADRLVCKRVLGLPGDVICADPTGQVIPSTEHVVVPPGHMWVIGDNASASRDSRMYGPVPVALLHSRIVARIWPLSRFTVFKNPTTWLN